MICGRPVQLAVNFRQLHHGHFEDRIDLVFEDTTLGQRFVVSRPMRAIVGSQQDYDLLRPTAPYTPRKRSKREAETEVVPGVVPESTNVIPWVVKLPFADIPDSLTLTLSNGSIREVMRALQHVSLPRVLTTDTYNRHFNILLWVEEYRME